MKRIYYLLRTVFTTGLLISSFPGCSDSFLDVSNPEEISENEFPKTINHVESTVLAAYGVAHTWTFLGQSWGGYTNYCLDHTVDMQWRGSSQWIDIFAGQIKVGNNMTSDPWKGLSQCIYYTNVALETIEKYREIAPPSETTQLDSYRGQCLFLRAFYHWHMMILYAQPNLDGVGIPLINHTSSSYKESQVVRATTRESYQSIIDDCVEAIPLLKGQTDKYFASEWSAKGLLAKAYLYMGDNANAKNQLEDIIHNSGKALVSYRHYRSMYQGDASFEHPSESLYETEMVANPITGAAYGTWNAGTTLSMLYSHFYIGSDPSIATYNTRQGTSYSNQFCHDRNLVRFGYTETAPLNHVRESDTKPTDHLFCRYSDTDNKYHYMEDTYMQRQLDMKERALAGQSVKGDPDPRFYVCVMQPFIDTVKQTGGTIDAPVSQAEFGTNWWTMDETTTGNNPKTFYGFCLRKYQFIGGYLSVDTKNVAGYNIYFMRLPEVYLMYAEILKNSDPTMALEYVNKVHRRAYGQNPDQVSPYDYQSLTDRTKTADPSDHLANDPIEYEFWAETFGEFAWWSEVRRKSYAPQEFDFYQYVHGPSTNGMTYLKGSNWQDYQYTMPIPIDEIESNPNCVQTPGY
ncbi:MAG: RagB/SusD family nutrient uptake outer membrane protein [Phocaeicola sp.]|uniref:RagB/SusD family nutrient uptake outer membrane protein n=1 Tax=Phocaeicola sp. TaxID=2773926 RepID=UPI003FA0BAD4